MSDEVIFPRSGREKGRATGGMSATTVTSCKTTTTTTFFPFSAPKPQSSPSKQLLYSYRCSTSSFVFSQFHVSSPSPLSCKLYPRSVSSSETNVVDEEAEESGTPPSDDVRSLDSGSLPPLTYDVAFHLLISAFLHNHLSQLIVFWVFLVYPLFT